MSTEDSLRVSENDDGTLCVEWNPNDPKYAIFNTMTEDELQDYITKALEQFIAEYASDNSGS